MSYVRAHTSLPVPRVLGIELAEHDDEGKNEIAHLTMEFIEGDPWNTAWPKMSEAHRASVVGQVRGFVAELRALPQPHPGWIDSCSGGPAMDHRVEYGDLFGPIASVSLFHDFLLQRFERHTNKTAEGRQANLKDHYPVVFSHADLSANHILIDPTAGKVVGIIDWEMAGFWPDYWEYRKALF
ncbi:hypothetical protein BOTBODRAFT_88634, partial [Botryobasidium botryosum FD-172 SS1]